MIAGLTPAAFAQDQGGDANTQARLAAGQTIDGAIDPAGDVDWFRLGVEQGQRYSFTLTGIARADRGAVDPMLGVYDLEGNQLAFNDDANGLDSALSYVPTQSGEVFVEARAFSEQDTGPYRLAVTAAAVPPDAVGNDASTRTRVTVGRAIDGELEYEGDVDWYRLTTRTGQRYTITLNSNQSAQTPLGDPFLRVLDSEGNELAVGDDTEGSFNAAIQYVPRTSGDVFIEARAYADAYVGGYTLNVSAERAPTDSISADRNTRGRIATGQTITSALDFAGDSDWYRIRLTEGESYRFTLSRSGDAPLGDPLVRIHGPDGAELAYDDDGGGDLNSYLEFTAPTTGNYFVEVSVFGGEGTGGYTLAAYAGDIAGDNTTDASLSADGDYREGVLSPAGDRDWYRVELSEGQALRIGVDTAQVGEGLGDPYVVLYGPDGSEVGRDDDGGEGLNAWLEYQATSTGAHFVEVRGYSEDASGRYGVSITPGEIGGSVDNADYLNPLGEPRSSIIGTPDDQDWFVIEMIEGRPYRISVTSDAENGLADPFLTLYDSQGNQVATDDDGGTGLNAYLYFASPTGGPYFAAVSSYGASSTGRYTIRIADTDVAGHIYTDEDLDANDDSRASRIEMAGDLDDYRVSLEADARYVIEVRGAGADPLADPFLAVLDSQGNRVATDDDGGDGLDARLRFTPSQPGEYYIQASGLGGSTGDYVISIVRQ